MRLQLPLDSETLLPLGGRIREAEWWSATRSRFIMGIKPMLRIHYVCVFVCVCVAELGSN